jgi:methanesulfonate monooxygenase large subunit
VIWSPFGRNLHEDLLASSGQGIAMASGSESDARAASARGRTDHPRRSWQCAITLPKWSRRMGRSASSPLAVLLAGARVA